MVAYDFFPDRDHDETPDELDECPSRAGTVNGCLPVLSGVPSFRTRTLGGSVLVRSLTVAGLPNGAVVTVRCGGGCTHRERLPVKHGKVKSKLTGRTIPVGSRVEIRVTINARRAGPYRFGAIGQYFRYTLTARGQRRIDRCLLPGSSRPRTRCR
jgi:hypothetical protein